jgi:hypothetical protein
MTSTDKAAAALALLARISEPIAEADHFIDCSTCFGATRTFDDPADCPECEGMRYIGIYESRS